MAVRGYALPERGRHRQTQRNHRSGDLLNTLLLEK